MSIDELGLFKLAGKNETDHNTIFVDVNIQLNPARADPRRTESRLLQMLSQSPIFFLFHCMLEDSVQTGSVCNTNFGLTGKLFANFG